MEKTCEGIKARFFAHPFPMDNCDNIFGDYTHICQLFLKTTEDDGAEPNAVRFLLSRKGIRLLSKQEYLEAAATVVMGLSKQVSGMQGIPSDHESNTYQKGGDPEGHISCDAVNKCENKSNEVKADRDVDHHRV